MNELKEICERLHSHYGTDVYFEVTKADKTENGWNLTVQPMAKEEEKDGGAANESNE